MVTTPIKPGLEEDAVLVRVPVPSWPPAASEEPTFSAKDTTPQRRELRPFGADALQALLAFSALHQQVRQRRALAATFHGFETINGAREFDAGEQFVLDQGLQLVAQRAISIP